MEVLPVSSVVATFGLGVLFDATITDIATLGNSM